MHDPEELRALADELLEMLRQVPDDRARAALLRVEAGDWGPFEPYGPWTTATVPRSVRRLMIALLQLRLGR
ncbi:MAG: hypothetical protein M3P51_18605 [Chloroflexota bacterium]|nr:hypothetical protein [Chloroflexota bacterium]